MRRFPHVAALEKGQAEVHLQSGYRRIDRCSFAVVHDGITVVLLLGFKKPDVRERFGTGGMASENGLPSRFGSGEVALLLESMSRVALSRHGRGWLGKAAEASENRQRCQKKAKRHNASHVHPHRVIVARVKDAQQS